MKKLPKTFRGAQVIRGLGMNSDKLEAFVDKKALDQFVATKAMWIVVEDKTLEDFGGSFEVKGFASKANAVRYARALANGNVDHRVLRVTDQMLVVGTDNDL